MLAPQRMSIFYRFAMEDYLQNLYSSVLAGIVSRLDVCANMLLLTAADGEDLRRIWLSILRDCASDLAISSKSLCLPETTV